MDRPGRPVQDRTANENPVFVFEPALELEWEVGADREIVFEPAAEDQAV